jgi:hypothetical protein
MYSTQLEQILILSVTSVLALKLHVHILCHIISNTSARFFGGGCFLRLSVFSRLYSFGGRMVEELKNICKEAVVV